MRNPLASRASIIISIGIIALATGVLTGLLVGHGVHIDSKLSFDGVVTALATLIAVIAATIVLPLTIQPLLTKQTGITTVTHEDIKSLLGLINEVTDTCEQFYKAKKNITIEDRQLMLTKHTKIHTLAGILKKQSNKIPALASFETDVYEPLNNSHTDFADQILPSKKITAAKLIAIRQSLDPVTYKLHELRYDIN